MLDSLEATNTDFYYQILYALEFNTQPCLTDVCTEYYNLLYSRLSEPLDFECCPPPPSLVSEVLLLLAGFPFGDVMVELVGFLAENYLVGNNQQQALRQAMQFNQLVLDEIRRLNRL